MHPRPHQAPGEHWVCNDGDRAGHLQGEIFVDGSALWPASGRARRAGWAAVVVDPMGNVLRAVYGAVPWHVDRAQTSGAAEVYAVRRAAGLRIGDVRLQSDYQTAVDGAKGTQAATTAPRRRNAASWRAFWKALDGEAAAAEVLKVKAHLGIESIEATAEARRIWAGNKAADKFA